MSFKDKVEKIVLEMGKGNFSTQIKEKFMRSLKKDISAALDENKKKYEEFLDERMSKVDEELEQKVEKYLEDKKKE